MRVWCLDLSFLKENKIISYSGDGTVLIWDGVNGNIYTKIEVDYPIARVDRLHNNILIVGTDFIDIYNMNGNHIGMSQGHNGPITGFLSYNNYFFTGSLDRHVKIWDENGTMVGNSNIHKSQITSIKACHNSIYSAGADGCIKTWRMF